MNNAGKVFGGMKIGGKNKTTSSVRECWSTGNMNKINEKFT